VSKHHAVDEEPQPSDMSWILGLGKPLGVSDPSALSDQSSYYSSLNPVADASLAPAARGRHSLPADDEVDGDRHGIPMAERTAGMRRISVGDVDTLIGRLDGFPVATAPPNPPDVSEADLVEAAVHEAAVDETAVDEADSDAATSAAPAPAASTGRLRKPLLVGTAALVCLLTVGGGTFSSDNKPPAAVAHKNISIVLDGQVQAVSTAAVSVAGALAAAGLSVTAHDTLAPAISAPISNGSTIVLDRGRVLTLTIDGRSRQVWTTARTVDAALAQLGTNTSRMQLSADRSRSIPLAGLSVTGSTLHTVAATVGGAASSSFTTAAKTVGELLTAHGVLFGRFDTVSPALGTALSDGLVITVNRVTVASTAETVPMPEPAAQSVDDATIVKGTSTVVQQGKLGSELVTYSVTSVNGTQTAKTESSRTTVTAPVGTITHVGIKTTFTYDGIEVFTNDTTFGVNWDGLANCESTHNPKAVNANPSAGLPTYGLFQFDLPTWASVGGSGNPLNATPEEQLMRAKLLFQQRGLEPWACRAAAH